MTKLRKQFSNYKKKIEKLRKEKLLTGRVSLFEEKGIENTGADPVNDFIKRKKISKKEMVRFYINEMTGLSEEEFYEDFFKGKTGYDSGQIRDAVMEAVRFKLRCELEDDCKFGIWD
jgi:hypothetical protein